jgi:glyoxylase-like metal-dependent hydrolase (beta-lactamase superfamily II)
MVLTILIGAGVLSVAAAGARNPPAGQPQAAGQGRGPQGPPVAAIEKVRENLYMLTGGGGNTAAFVTDTGVVVVDTKLAGWGQAILDKIKTVTDKPVTMIINTHTHGDHTGSNDFFGATVDTVAHENTKSNMVKMDAFKGENAKFLPKRTFKNRMTLGSGKDEIDLYYFGPGHTNGDTFVVFRQPRVMHAGDMFAGKSIPLVDANNGGSVVNYGKTLAAAAATIKDVDAVITGHSTVMTPADLKEYADFNTDFVSWVQDEMKAGKTPEEAAAEFKMPDKYKGYGMGATVFGGYKGNIERAYGELKK